MEGPGLAKIARAFKLNESIVRQQTIKLEPRLVEPILANARGEAIVKQTTDEPEAEPSADDATPAETAPA